MPDDTRVLTHSRMACYRACPRKHYLSYELGIRPDRRGAALRLGSAVHAGLDLIRKGMTVAESIDVATAGYEEAPAWARSDADVLEWCYERETVAQLIGGYHWYWTSRAAPIDMQYEQVVESEQVFSLPIVRPGAKRPVPGGWRLKGKRDGVVMVGGQMMLLETKTTGADIGDDSPYWDRLFIDQQISVYMLASGGAVAGVLYDVIRKPTIRPYKVSSKRAEPETPAEWGQRLHADIGERPDYYFRRRKVYRLQDDLLQAQGEIAAMVDTIKDARNRRSWPRNTGACIGFGACEYLKVCAQHIDHDNIPAGFARVAAVHGELDGDPE